MFRWDSPLLWAHMHFNNNKYIRSYYRSKQSLKTHMQMHFIVIPILHMIKPDDHFDLAGCVFFSFNFCFFACVRCRCCCYVPVHFERVKKKKQRERKINKTERMPTANGHSRLGSMDIYGYEHENNVQKLLFNFCISFIYREWSLRKCLIGAGAVPTGTVFAFKHST